MTIRFRLAVLALLGGLLGLPSLSVAADPGLRVNADTTFGVITIHAEILVPADAKTAWAVLTDYDNLARFVPEMKSSRVTSAPGQPKRVEQRGKSGMLSFFTFPGAGFGGYVVLNKNLRGKGFLTQVIARVEEQMLRAAMNAQGWYIECDPMDDTRPIFTHIGLRHAGKTRRPDGAGSDRGRGAESRATGKKRIVGAGMDCSSQILSR